VKFKVQRHTDHLGTAFSPVHGDEIYQSRTSKHVTSTY